MRRNFAIGLVTLAAVVGLLYAAHAMDLMGMLLSMHTPPANAH